MATNDERRKAAQRLRECRGGWSSGECYYTIIHELGLPDTSREDGAHALYAALADLIEPEPERKCHDVARGDEFFRCSSCGAALSVEYGDSRLFMNGYLCLELDYCPFCGAKVVGE